MIRLFSHLLLLLFSVSCARTRSDIVMAEKHMSSFAKKMQTSNGLSLIGEGGGMMDDIEDISMSFVSHRRYNLNEARKFIVEITEDFLNEINSDEKIRPYLHNYPFTSKNLHLAIAFEERVGYVSREYIAQVSLVSGKLGYLVQQLPEDYWLSVIHEETYSEALEKSSK